MVKTTVETKTDPSSPSYPPPFSITRWLGSLWAFSRPHTIVGTVLSVGALGVMALALMPGTDALVPMENRAIWMVMGMMGAALVPSLCANVYIVGLNQLTDIAIDRINKPQLPLASGAYSVTTGRSIVWVMGGLAILGAIAQGPILATTVGLSMVIGTMYSLPPLRLKRFPFWAALCIFGVRGVIVNVGFFLHFRQQLSTANTAWQALPPEVWALTTFVILFAFAIAIFKDIPDMEGDRQFQVRTLTVRLGPRFVFQLSRWVLTGCYGLLMGLTLMGRLPAIQPLFLMLTHLTLLGLMWWRSDRVDIQNHKHVSRFYQFIWRLFFVEYLLFPIACLIGP